MALPEPVQRVTRNRSVDLRWRTPSLDKPDAHEDHEAHAELSIYHDRTGKSFVAHLGTAHVHSFSVRREITFGSKGGGTILTRPVARYSEKAMLAFEQAALSALRDEYAAGAERVLALLPVADVEVAA